jgi:hypothetical protein
LCLRVPPSRFSAIHFVNILLPIHRKSKTADVRAKGPVSSLVRATAWGRGMERNVRLGEVSHLVMAFLHEERAVFPATRAAFEHEAREALQTVRPGRRGVKTLYEILDEYLELKQERKDRQERRGRFKCVHAPL